jgi:hypothetical protein
MTISRARHITSTVVSVSGAFLATRDRSPSSALFGGVVLGLGLGVGSIRRRGSRR